MNKTLIIYGIIIAVIGILVVKKYFNQTQLPTQSPLSFNQDTSNWKTYQNSDIGFSIKYPNNFYPVESQDSPVLLYDSQQKAQDELACLNKNGNKSCPRQLFDFSVSRKNKSDYRRLKEVYKQTDNIPSPITEYRDSQNRVWTIREPAYGLGGDEMEADLEINGQIFVVNTHIWDQEFKNYVNSSLSEHQFANLESFEINLFFKKLLSSFMLSNVSNQVIWKTYTNTQFGYSISYPENWPFDQSTYGVNISSPNKAKDNQVFHIDISVVKTDQPINQWLKGKTIGGICCAEEFSLQDYKPINEERFYKVIGVHTKYPGIIGQHNGYIFWITGSSGYLDGGIYYYDISDPVLMINLRTFDQIVDTFKLL
ncbi:hypothetical protein HY025_01565 [Candidatus Daviesbacteria bacterium]|nr:hypothetical protein [Candidatus Daviesbacteria bacterium]